jgi:hypothetical protein
MHIHMAVLSVCDAHTLHAAVWGLIALLLFMELMHFVYTNMCPVVIRTYTIVHHVMTYVHI